MRKKIYKYLKIIFSIALVVSIIIPSYATTADGDAFLTSDEFNKSISDFSKRISTFEAGINSKIDMQVTSYLDRNGIWSGKDEPLAAPYAINTPITFRDKGDIVNNWVKFNADKNSAITDIYASKWYHYDIKLWTNIRKKGLMRVALSFENNSNFKMNRSGIRINNSDAWEKQYVIGFAITALPSTETVDMKNNVKILHVLSTNSMYNDYQSDHKAIELPNVVEQAFFFVEKGWDVWFSTCWQVVSNNSRGTPTVTMTNLSPYDDADGAGDEILTITDAKIY